MVECLAQIALINRLATKRPATQWAKPGIIGHLEHLRDEEDLRHASLRDFREDSHANSDKGK